MRSPRTTEMLTLDQFRAWLFTSKADIQFQPFAIVACQCGDTNCHGWRLIKPTRECPAERPR